MVRIMLESDKAAGIEDIELEKALNESIEQRRSSLKKVLLLPPDFSRSHSGAGKITAMYYKLLKESCQIDIMPALGTHMPMTRHEILEMFGNEIPESCFIVHNWREDVVNIGEVPGEFVKEVSEGLINNSIPVEVNRRLLDKSYDMVISIGQVVPHEVVGMANYSKNIFVGCGGRRMINNTHMLGAVYGMERVMGRDKTPVRKVFDYAEENFGANIPLMYVLTVTVQNESKTSIQGLYIGRERGLFEEAVKLSEEKNISFVDKPLNKVIVYLDGKEFKSTWIGNKAIYRSRMALADNGELIIIAPGVRQFGEDLENDKLIRKYGYVGRYKVLEMFKEIKELQENQSVAAHLIHGSSDGRFTISYAVDKLSKEEIKSVNFNYIPLNDAYKKYNPEKLKDGFNTMEDGEEIFFISNPALGLWANRDKFY